MAPSSLGKLFIYLKFHIIKEIVPTGPERYFFQSVLSIYGTNYLFQPILDPYDYSCIVSAVWIYPVIYIYNFSM